jgi:hypothetical protein
MRLRKNRRVHFTGLRGAVVFMKTQRLFFRLTTEYQATRIEYPNPHRKAKART